MPKARVELACPRGRQILSLLGLPFPHSGIDGNKRISVVTFLKSHSDDIPHHQDVQRRNFTYITSLSSPSILGESAIETPTLDSQTVLNITNFSKFGREFLQSYLPFCGYGWIRTIDFLCIRQVLYQLSYIPLIGQFKKL